MHPAKIGILGNFNEDYRPHYVMDKVFKGLQRFFSFHFEWIPTETLVDDAADKLSDFQGIVAGSGPYKSKEGVINGIRYARTNNIPFMGTCSGFGYAVLEFGQWLFGLDTVSHVSEGVSLSPGETFLQPLNHCSLDYRTICFKPEPGTLTSLVYDHAETISELTHCSYGIHAEMIAPFGKEGLVISARDEEGEAKMMEYDRNDFFIIVLFLPQLNSAPDHPILYSLRFSRRQKGRHPIFHSKTSVFHDNRHHRMVWVHPGCSCLCIEYRQANGLRLHPLLSAEYRW